MASLKVVTIFSLAIIVCNVAEALKCKAGTPTLGKLTEPNLPDTTCGVYGTEDVCYVMFTDYDNDNYDAWTYGCILKGSLDKCDKSFERSGVTNNYCCCRTAGCNDKDFAAKCKKGSSGRSAVNAASVALIALLLCAVKFILA